MAKREATAAPVEAPTVRVRYTGDGTAYVIGHPAEPGHEQDVDAATAEGLIESGLYEAATPAPVGGNE